MRKSRFTAGFCAAWILFFGSHSLGFQNSTAQLPSTSLFQNENSLGETGTYVRRILFFHLYRITFLTLPPSQLVDVYRAEQAAAAAVDATVDTLADFLLDPDNSIPLQLNIEILRGGVGCSRQENAVRTILQRAGFPVDENWNLVRNKELQKEIDLFITTIMGADPAGHKRVCRDIEKGDQFILTITARDEASVRYQPASGREKARSEAVLLPSSMILRGVFSTYLSTRNCNPALTEDLPPALLGSILAAYTRNDKARTADTSVE